MSLRKNINKSVSIETDHEPFLTEFQPESNIFKKHASLISDDNKENLSSNVNTKRNTDKLEDDIKKCGLLLSNKQRGNENYSRDKQSNNNFHKYLKKKRTNFDKRSSQLSIQKANVSINEGSITKNTLNTCMEHPFELSRSYISAKKPQWKYTNSFTS